MNEEALIKLDNLTKDFGDNRNLGLSLGLRKWLGYWD